MRDLRLHLRDTDFEKLLETARALIPTLAPQWTDHNIHDPGIMLVELMAWIADAQIYALARPRRDERAAYAALLGVQARGPVPARGLVWPALDENGEPTGTWPPGLVLTPEAPITPKQPDAPAFRTTDTIVLSRARLTGLHTRFAAGSQRDWTRANTQARATFAPFSDPPDPADRLMLEFDEGFGKLGTVSADALLSIGFEIESPPLPDDADLATGTVQRRDAWKAAWIDDERGLRALDVVDTTGGLLRSGVLLIRARDLATGSGKPTLVLGGAGLTRSPQVRRIALDVLPVVQAESQVDEDPQFGTDAPDQQHRLWREGLLVEGRDPTEVVTLGPEGVRQWTLVPDLENQGPDASAYTLDAASGTLSFGNGINGATVPAGAALRVSYHTSAGLRGNLPPGTGFAVQGVVGDFGSSSEATGGGADRDALDDLRRSARHALGHAHPLVTKVDLEAAARGLPELGVMRATEVLPSALRRDVGGLRVLIVVGSHDGRTPAPDSPAWRTQIMSSLAPRLPLGQRLQVIAPRYMRVQVKAKLVAAPRVDPAAVAREAVKALRQAFGLAGDDAWWPYGRDVTALALSGRLRKVAGVARVKALTLRGDGVAAPDGVLELGPTQLPWLELSDENIVVERPQGVPS